jgi:exopolyphosphatase/guanosine-5'-triphosphate,3'-diphosphate pyrophosphatase
MVPAGAWQHGAMQRLGLTTQRELRAADVEAVRDQLGREPTTPFVVVCRCTGGHPLVIRNAPLDVEGYPFPTTYWLTCPEAVKAVARIESEGAIADLNGRIQTDAAFAAAVKSAHAAYAEDRGQDLEEARGWGGVAGTRTGIKCLHAHYAFHIAGGEDPVGAWVAARVEPAHPPQRAGRVAAIDQGTNSCRLLVVEPGTHAGDDPTELARDMVITRLGQDVDATGRLDPDAIARTLAVIARYCRRARALGAEGIRVGATSAVRDAVNRDEFAAAVRAEAGSDLEIVTGEQEAALSFLGGTYGLESVAVPGPYLVQDIGGGSTEFVMGARAGHVDAAISTQMGSVRLTERLVHHDPPTEDELRALGAEIDTVLDHVAAQVPIRDARTLIGVAGTATTLQAIALGLTRYDPDRIHRSWLAYEDVRRLLGDIARMTNAERAAIPVMAPGRGDVIVAGAVILETVMRRFGFERTLVSETDILDGLALERLGVR